MKLMEMVAIALLSVVLICTVACEAPKKTYTLYTSTNGQGSITPNGGTFSDGDEVTLIAIPGSGWEFSNWAGDCTGSQNPTTIHIDHSKTVVAFFIQSGTAGSKSTPVIYPTQIPSPTTNPTGTSSEGPVLHFGTSDIEERYSGGTMVCRYVGKDLSNSGDPGNVFVSLSNHDSQKLIASKVFYMDKGEQVRIIAFATCSAGSYTYAWTARAALPGDTSYGNMTVERNISP